MGMNNPFRIREESRMELHGQNLIGNSTSGGGGETYTSVNPATGSAFGIPFHVAQATEVNRAVELAEQAFPVYRSLPAERSGSSAWRKRSQTSSSSSAGSFRP